MLYMECPLQEKNLRVKDTREKQLCVMLSETGFVTAVQSIMIMLASIGSVWVDLWNYYKMRELV